MLHGLLEDPTYLKSNLLGNRNNIFEHPGDADLETTQLALCRALPLKYLLPSTVSSDFCDEIRAVLSMKSSKTLPVMMLWHLDSMSTCTFAYVKRVKWPPDKMWAGLVLRCFTNSAGAIANPPWIQQFLQCGAPQTIAKLVPITRAYATDDELITWGDEPTKITLGGPTVSVDAKQVAYLERSNLCDSTIIQRSNGWQSYEDLSMTNPTLDLSG